MCVDFKAKAFHEPIVNYLSFFVIDFIYQIFNNPEEPFILHSNTSIFIYIQELSFYTREIGHETKLSFSIVHAWSDIWQYSLWNPGQIIQTKEYTLWQNKHQLAS